MRHLVVARRAGGLSVGRRWFHDIGGATALLGNALPADKPSQAWEMECHALFAVLAKDQHLSTDELRRAIEALPAVAHEDWGYYERWSAAMAALLREKNILQPGELESALFSDSFTDGDATTSPMFGVGDRVRVKLEPQHQRPVWRKPHLRTPGYIFGVAGNVERWCGEFSDPSFLAFGVRTANPQHLYRVRFEQRHLWPEHESASRDTVDVEVYEEWLEPAGAHEPASLGPSPTVNYDHFPVSSRSSVQTPHKHGHNRQDDDHHHHHHDAHPHGDSEHPHEHLSRPQAEVCAVAAEGAPRPGAAVHEALVRILLQRGLVSRPQLQSVIQSLETAGAELPAARLICRAWVDEAFAKRLLANGNAAARELGINASNPNAPTELCCVMNDAEVHNLVVCTLCSCYPAALLGPSPSWYKSRAYRAQAVRQPRVLLRDTFGLNIPDDVALRVHDSTADLRYLVIPRRPEDTEGWSEERLRELVTRDGMLGCALT